MRDRGRVKDEVKEEIAYGGNASSRSGEVKKEIPDKSKYVRMEPSGLLAEETNTKNGIVVKHTLPPDARRAKVTWRLYMFKGTDDESRVVPLTNSKCFLIGKDVRVVDIPMMHPTVSKQHAVIVYRQTAEANNVKPYLMDLESTNGTFLNGEKLEPLRYYELKKTDSIRFAKSSRDFVALPDDMAETKEIKVDEVLKKRLQEEEAKATAPKRQKTYW